MKYINYINMKSWIAALVLSAGLFAACSDDVLVGQVDESKYTTGDGSVMAGTIGFALILVTWGIYSMNQLMENLNAMDIQELLTSVLIKYIVFMLAYMAITYFVYNRRYTKGRREVKKYYGNLKKLNQLYEREDKLKMSENKDWE